jgi:acetyl-CoA carboxylase carboxyl transferase subunit beta
MSTWDDIKKFVFGNDERRDVPEGLWQTCDECENMVYKKEVEEKNKTCPECEYHFPLTAEERIDLLIDDGTFEETWEDLRTVDPLNFEARKKYKDKLKEAQDKTGLPEAIITGKGELKGREVMFGVTDRNFIMGSMGSVVGEKVTRSFEMAKEEDLPFVMVSGSGGGARMYEGAISLMQMAKTSAAAARYDESGNMFISVLTNATMAGVLASFASLGDLIIAEPGALIGFTGPRVIKQTIQEELPEGFQRSEFLLEHGFLDRIVARKNMRDEISKMLDYGDN